ncbi:MAG: hypothetical protein RLP14_07015 [Owenweeksia sp.]
MLNKLKTLSILSILMSFLLFACQKEENDMKAPVNQKSMTDLWPQAANPSNPTDDNLLGVYHNHGLIHFAEQRAAYSTDAEWFREVYAHNLDFLCNPDDPNYCPEMTEAELSDLVQQARTDFNSVIADKPANVQGYVDAILTTFDDHTAGSYDGFKNDIMAIEAAVVDDPDMSQSDRNMLLNASQVARYSGFYWSEQVNNGMSNWQDTDADVAAAIDWGDVAKADVKGAVAGFFGGLFGGNPLGGAAGGALGASAAELIDQVW